MSTETGRNICSSERGRELDRSVYGQVSEHMALADASKGERESERDRGNEREGESREGQTG